MVHGKLKLSLIIISGAVSRNGEHAGPSGRSQQRATYLGTSLRGLPGAAGGETSR